jgi:cellulose biosynthesis protein BcsQ
VGKKTTTANLGAALAELGLKVLMVDLDAQCNLTSFYSDATEIQTERIINNETYDAIEILQLLNPESWESETAILSDELCEEKSFAPMSAFVDADKV